jgi:hypothetical protein
MAIFTLQTPTYDAPSDVTKYGQAGGTPSHRFFYNTPGETLTLDPGFDSQSNRGYGGYTPVGTLDTPSGTEMLLGAGASYLANDAGINAGRHAYDTLAQTGVQPTFLDSIGPGIQKTVDNVGNFATSVSDSLKNTFVGPSGAPPNTGFSNAQFVQPVRYPTAGGSISGNLLTPPVPQGTGISLADPVLGPMGDYTSAINSLSDVSIASPTFGGESLAAPAAQTGNLVTGGGTSASLAAAPGTPMWSGGDFATNFQFGGMQAGLFGGAASLGLGLLMGQDFKTAAKGAAVSGIGTAVGYAIGGPIGGFLGGTLPVCSASLVVRLLKWLTEQQRTLKSLSSVTCCS